MQILSAFEAVSPALTRTREVLFGSRRFGTFVKISLVATLAAMGDGLNMRFNYGHSGPPVHTNSQMAAALAALAAFGVLIALVFGAIFLVLFYVGNRMQFVLFDMVLTRRTEVKLPWRWYANRTWRWIGTKVLLFLTFTAVVLLACIPLFLKLYRAGRQGVAVTPHAFFGVFLSSALVLFVIFLIFFVISAMLHDFVLPAVALEDARVFSTLGRVASLYKADSGQVTLYILLRLVFALLMVIATVIVVVLCAIVFGIVLGLIAAFLYAVLHKGGMVALSIMVLAFLVEGLVFLGLLLAVDAIILGWATTFQQAWALYFLGGRYTLLGEALDRSQLPPVTYTAPPPPPPQQAWDPSMYTPPGV